MYVEYLSTSTFLEFQQWFATKDTSYVITTWRGIFFPPISRRMSTFPLWMWLNKVCYVGEGWWSLFVCVCRAWLSPWRSVCSWGPTAFCLRASSARTSSWCGCSRTMTWGRMIWTGEADIHALTETHFLISRRLQLSWGEFPQEDFPPTVHTERSYIWKPSEHEREISDHPSESHIHLRTRPISLNLSPSLCFASHLSVSSLFSVTTVFTASTAAKWKL